MTKIIAHRKADIIRLGQRASPRCLSSITATCTLAAPAAWISDTALAMVRPASSTPSITSTCRPAICSEGPATMRMALATRLSP